MFCPVEPHPRKYAVQMLRQLLCLRLFFQRVVASQSHAFFLSCDESVFKNEPLSDKHPVFPTPDLGLNKDSLLWLCGLILARITGTNSSLSSRGVSIRSDDRFHFGCGDLMQIIARHVSE